ncbi:hypothetical protein MNB_SUP05-SYMBIONT-4-639 [hydrothermal vent metagenome]|uniref:Uncharacterized protein n=1 Tax=hydrothermal vent metagenome TaxID=652676 RepID=A0A1W1E4S2_9ZZZZ
MIDEENKRFEADIAQVMANTVKLGAETAKLNKETFWYPMVLSTGLVIAVATVVKYAL